MGSDLDWEERELEGVYPNRRKAFGRKQRWSPIQIAMLATLGCFGILVVLGAPLLSAFQGPKAPVVPLQPIKTPTAPATIDIYYPMRRIESGTLLEPDMFRKVPKLRSDIPALSANVVTSEDQFAGRFSRIKLLPGSPVLSSDIVDDIDNIIAQKLLPGYRAVTVKVDDVSGIEGWSTPGARIDVLWIAPSAGSTNAGPDTIAKTIVTDAQILSVMGRTQQDGSGGTGMEGNQGGSRGDPSYGYRPKMSQSFTVTIGVRAADGQKVALAASTGKIVLMLRGQLPTDAEDMTGTSISASELLGGNKKDPNSQRIDGTVRVKRGDGGYDDFALVGRDLLKWEKDNTTARPPKE